MNIATDNRKLSYTYDKTKDNYTILRGSTPVQIVKTEQAAAKWIKDEQKGLHLAAQTFFLRRLKPTMDVKQREALRQQQYSLLHESRTQRR